MGSGSGSSGSGLDPVAGAVVSPSRPGRQLLNLWAFDPGGTTGFQSVIVACDVSASGRVSLPQGLDAVEAINRARTAGWFYGGQLDSSVWTEHVDVMCDAVNESGEWCREKAKALSGAGYVGARTHVVIEGFVLGGAALTGDALSPVRIEAGFQYAMSRGAVAVDSYSTPLPAAKAQASDERLRRWGLYEPTSPHKMDARRHMLVHLRALEAG